MAVNWQIPTALPPLRGWAANVYGVIWVMLLAISVIGIAGGAWHVAHTGAGQAYSHHQLGLALADEDSSHIERIAPDVAHDTGVRVGDRLLSLDGMAIPRGILPSALDDRIAGHLLHDHAPVRLVVQHAQTPPRTVFVTPGIAHADALYAGTGLTPVSLSWLSAVVSVLAPMVMVTGAVLLFGRRRDSVAALLSLALLGSAMNTSLARYFWGDGAGTTPIEMIVGTIGSLGLLMSVAVFPAGRFEPRWTFWIMLAMPLVFLIQLRNHPLGHAMIGLVLAAMAGMIIRYRRETPAARRVWRWALIGFTIGVTLEFTQRLLYGSYLDSHHDFDAEVWSWICTPLLETTPLAIIAAGVVLSVLRYRLYDTQAAISRSVLYGTLTLVLLAIFAGSEKLIEIIGERYFGESIGMFAGGLGAAFAAVAIAPLHHRLSHWVEHRFRKNLIHLRHDLPPLLTELGETSDPAHVAHAALDHLAHGLHTLRGAVIAHGEVLAARGIEPAAIAAPDTAHARRVGTLTMRRRDALFPVHIPLAADGTRWLLLGPRPDDSLYDRQEREVLTDLATPLAHALRISAQRSAREAMVDARLAGIEQALAAMTSSPRSIAAE